MTFQYILAAIDCKFFDVEQINRCDARLPNYQQCVEQEWIKDKTENILF